MFLATIFLSAVSFGNLPAWELTDNIKNPESVYFDESSKSVFISNIAGEGTAKDGIGWISKLTDTGKLVKEKWVDGLNAPKGMRAHQGVLWVTDIDTVIAIDIKSAKVLNRYKIAQAQFLNDIAITQDNVVYVSDTIGRAIHKIQNGKVEIFLSGDETESPNGLIIQEDKLIVAAWGLAEKDWSSKVPGHLYSLDLKTKEKTLITKNPLGNLDGLERESDGNYLVTDWMAGFVYRVSSKGEVTKLAILEERGVADIGYLPSSGTLLVPYMNSHRVRGYSLKNLKAK